MVPAADSKGEETGREEEDEGNKSDDTVSGMSRSMGLALGCAEETKGAEGAEKMEDARGVTATVDAESDALEACVSGSCARKGCGIVGPAEGIDPSRLAEGGTEGRGARVDEASDVDDVVHDVVRSVGIGGSSGKERESGVGGRLG